jgi:hypothetical protein
MRTWEVCKLTRYYINQGELRHVARLHGYVNADDFDAAVTVALAHWPHLSVDEIEITCTDIYGAVSTDHARSRAVNGAA